MLVGKTITDIYLADDRQAIRFDVKDGQPIIARCDGDCCSTTWIEDIINPEALFNNEVIQVFDIDLPESMQQVTKTDNYEEVMEYYGCAIETSQGRCTIAYRNSSNGYYGGSLNWPSEYHYGGVHNQNVSSEKWNKLTTEG